MIAQRLFSIYYFIKYLPLRLWRHRGPMEHKGFVGVQIDGLAHDDLVYAIEQGHLPQLRRRLKTHEYKLFPFPAGLPSATSYVQAGMFYGENVNIPAFRWYEREDRRVVNCNRPHSADYIRAQLGPRVGVLKGGSSYANLVDGDADRSVLTINSSVPRSFFEELGGWRLLCLLLLHPVRVARTLAATLLEVFVELYDRYVARHGRRGTVAEGWFPFIRALSNVLLREIQTVAVMADIYAGVPYIFTTYASYDEMAHHYGPRARPTLKNLRGIVRRIIEIERIIRRLPGRHYDLIILSDHGQTEGDPFLGLFKVTLGELIHHHLEGQRVLIGPGQSDVPFAQTRDLYAKHLQRRAEKRSFLARGLLRSFARRLRKIASVESFLTERYYVDTGNDVVVTYSGTLALVYFARWPQRLDDVAIRREFGDLLDFLVHHPGIGLVVTKASDDGVILRSRRGLARLTQGQVQVLEGENPLEPYGTGTIERQALQRMGSFTNTGDLILFGAYDGHHIVCFDDQVASHGCLGGPQFWPFLMVPNDPRFEHLSITDPRDLYSQVFFPYHHEEPGSSPSAPPHDERSTT